MRKIFITTLALTTLAATSAMAAPQRHQAPRVSPAAAAAQASVVSDGIVVGQDPDAYVRLELLRSAGSENQG
jgi:hypothetical protein